MNEHPSKSPWAPIGRGAKQGNHNVHDEHNVFCVFCAAAVTFVVNVSPPSCKWKEPVVRLICGIAALGGIFEQLVF